MWGALTWVCRRHIAFVDSEGRILAVLAGHPHGDDDGWDKTRRGAYAALDAARSQLEFQGDGKDRRRGKFPSIHTGISYGRGHTEPKELNLGKNKEVVYCLKRNCHVRRIIGFGSSVVALNSPKLYRKYEHMVDRLLEHHEGLSLPHDNSIFATTTFNFGPHATTKAHVDSANLAHGWCTITPLGEFDHKRGGHLVLWQMGVIIEFPSGSTAAIPSGSVPHGNTDIQDGETRACITQYTSGALFRYVEYGFRSQKAFEKEDAKGFAEVYSQRSQRATDAMGLFSHLSALEADVREVFGLGPSDAEKGGHQQIG
ncbi:hypothetical protein FA95DRAFT_1505880 [Auriscalpium vulgare]|uniref:Uncharacterized protein n=1 Tax=Auriscalpium vulgare TaxID=40419 RepID=A0ACB8R302_9AGAM|nr:hypothetical protein FA95DRAFT_1505880 [Auriscalpium vulgare]